LYAAFDVLGVVLIISVYFWAKAFIIKEDSHIKKTVITLQDFTVFLPNVHPDTTRVDVEQWVSRSVFRAFERGAINPYALVKAINDSYSLGPDPSFINCRKGEAPRSLLAEVFSVARVDLIPDQALLSGLIKQSGALKSQLSVLDGQALAAAVTCSEALEEINAGRSKRKPEDVKKSLSVALTKLRPPTVDIRVKIPAVDLKLDNVVQGKLREKGGKLGSTVAVFVTFEHALARDAFVAIFSSGNSLWGSLYRRFSSSFKPFYLLGTFPKVLKPPAPSSINFLNLRFTTRQRALRSVATNILALIVMLVCFGLILKVNFEDQALQRLINPVDCSTSIYQTFVNFYTTKRSPSDEPPFLSFFPNTHPFMFCVCRSLPFKTSTLDSLLNNKYTRKCTFETCPALTKLNSPFVKEWPECVELASNSLKAQIFHTVTGVVVAVINIVLASTVQFFSSFEGYHSTVEQDVSVTARTFLILLFNTLGKC